jgi:intracellular multiplication protein IcmE
MAGRKENLKALFTNTRSRIIIIFTLLLLILAILYGLTRLMRSTNGAASDVSGVAGPPVIQSIPGALDPTIQYAKLQESQNISQAQAALKTGDSAIPTIVRSQQLGSGVQSLGSQGGQGGLSFTGLTVAQQAGNPRDLWLQDLQTSNCSKAIVNKVVSQGASLTLLRNACTCIQLKDVGYQINALQQVCSCQELKAAGFNARQFKSIGYTASRLHTCEFNACELRAVGFAAQELKNGGFTDGELKGAGFSNQEIARASGLPNNLSVANVRSADCQANALARLRSAGVSASAIRRINGCNAAQLKAAGFSAQQLREAEFTPAELSQVGKHPVALMVAGKKADCSIASLKAARAAGISATRIRETLGCDAAALKAAGFSAAELREAGFTAADLKNAGFSAQDLVNAGFTPEQIREAGFTSAQLQSAGLSPNEIASGQGADSHVPGLNALSTGLATNSAIPSIAGPSIATPVSSTSNIPPANLITRTPQIQAVYDRQAQQMADQRYQQRLQDRQGQMLAAANQYLQNWAKINTQVYTAGNPDIKVSRTKVTTVNRAVTNIPTTVISSNSDAPQQKALIKTGDILFAVIDTSVNSDEPGPILATVVSGRFKGAKLIGSFNLPANADKMVISFNVMSVPGASRSTPINAYAIDINTARTALSSRTDHHYLLRYGSLFASSFLEGIGNAIQSADTQVTIGGTGGGDNITIQNGIGRSTLENAVIGLATVGRNWGQVAQQQFSTPTTVYIYSGTGVGILFTQDLMTL